MKKTFLKDNTTPPAAAKPKGPNRWVNITLTARYMIPVKQVTTAGILTLFIAI